MKQKKIKAWAVIWTEKAKPIYGMKDGDEIIVLELSHSVDSVYAIFETKGEARNVRDGNSDWKVAPCEIIIKIPKKK